MLKKTALFSRDGIPKISNKNRRMETCYYNHLKKCSFLLGNIISKTKLKLGNDNEVQGPGRGAGAGQGAGGGEGGEQAGHQGRRRRRGE